MRRRLDTSTFEPYEVVTPQEFCAECGGALVIVQHRTRPLQTLQQRLLVVAKDKTCRTPDCPSKKVLLRPPLEGELPVVRNTGYGLDVLAFIGEQRLDETHSLPEVHSRLVDEFGIRISERHVSYLLRVYLALVHALNAGTQALKQRLQKLESLSLAIDGVFFDDVSPALYVIREVQSREILFAERIDRRDAESLGRFLSRVTSLGIPVAGVISDKEHALVAAVAAVLPGVPHQYCQVHLLKNLTKLMEKDLATVSSAVNDVNTELKKLERNLDTLAKSEGSLPAEVVVTRKLIQAARTGAKVAGDPILNPAPLKRFARLERVSDAVKQARKKKGGSWPLLSRLGAALRSLFEHEPLTRRLRTQTEIVQKVAHILNTTTRPGSGRRVLSRYLNDLDRTAPTRGRGTPRGDFMREVVNVVGRYWPGLFYCYEVQGLPRTNNGLEQTFAILKRHERRTTGRKSTVGGPLESCAPLVLEAWSKLQIEPRLQKLLSEVPASVLNQAREDLEAMAEPARLRRGIQRDPEGHLEETLDAWRGGRAGSI